NCGHGVGVFRYCCARGFPPRRQRLHRRGVCRQPVVWCGKTARTSRSVHHRATARPKEANVQRRLAAIMAADMVGYSRLMAADESGTLARLKSCRKELIGPALGNYGGRIFKSTGDGFLAEFASAVEAVQCALEVQLAIADQEAKIPSDRRIEYRIGI